MHVPRIKPCFKACTEACFTCFTNSTYIFFFSSKTVHINLITPLITLSLQVQMVNLCVMVASIQDSQHQPVMFN